MRDVKCLLRILRDVLIMPSFDASEVKNGGTVLPEILRPGQRLPTDEKNLTHDDLASLTTPTPPRILVVDDDPSFGRIMLELSKESLVSLTVCTSIGELDTLKRWKFDAAILDYDLGHINGLELAKRLKHHLGKAPIILVSQTQQVETPISRWPSTVKSFIHKSIGHHAILDTAVAALEVVPVKWGNGGKKRFL